LLQLSTSLNLTHLNTKQVSCHYKRFRSGIDKSLAFNRQDIIQLLKNMYKRKEVKALNMTPDP